MLDLLSAFDRIVGSLRGMRVRYALVGGLAVGMHGFLRMTKDIDFLVHSEDVPRFAAALRRCGFRPAGAPCLFPNSGLTLHRFFRAGRVDGDLLVVDVLAASLRGHRGMIQRAERKVWPGASLRVVCKRDLIRLKASRLSALDRADIEKLREGKRP